MSYTVYIHTTPNKKNYIGITSKSVKGRWSKGYRFNVHFQNAINLYGWGNIEHRIVAEGLTKEEAEQMEIDLIKKYKATDRRFGYNCQEGGNLHTPSVEGRKRISEARKGKALTEEHKAKLSKAKQGKPSTFKGKHHTVEANLKNALAHKGKHTSAENHNSKKVMCIETGEIFNSQRDAAKSINIMGGEHIGECCKGKRNAVGGFHWKYA